MTENFVFNQGARLWFGAAGRGNPTLYLHGGPGYNSYTFAKLAGPRLELGLKMIYLDQRGSGRSRQVESGAPMDFDALVADVEAIRAHLEVPKLSLIAHSFGGLIALEYARRFPAHVSRMILMEISPDLPALFRSQVQAALEFFPEFAIGVHENSPVQTLARLNQLIGEARLARALLWHNSDNQQRHWQLDRDSGLLLDRSNPVAQTLLDSGFLDRLHADLLTPLMHPATLFCGRHSRCVGLKNLRAAAAAWRAPLVMFQASGHFPYAEEMKMFTDKVREFLMAESDCREIQP